MNKQYFLPGLLINLVLILFLSSSCEQKIIKKNPYQLNIIDDLDVYKELIIQDPDKELVDLEVFIPGIILDIRYAGLNNFTEEIIYRSPKAYVRRPVAQALKGVQDELLTMGLAIKVFDAYRPYAATLKFYEVYPDTVFVAAPWRGSVHNRGCAIDLTLVNLDTGFELEMPTSFDDFTESASHNYSDLTERQLKNRKILSTIMIKHGFTLYVNEWWHYNYKDYKKYELMNIYFEELE